MKYKLQFKAINTLHCQTIYIYDIVYYMGTLYLVSTPIGNLEDITLRAIKVLLTVPVIACEDTRRTGLLLLHLEKYARALSIIPNLKRTLVRLDEQTEQTEVPGLIGKLKEGVSVALISDAGTPLVSDPGYLLVSGAHKHNIATVAVPGPSAILTAIASSGLPVNHFTFLGFLPEKEGARKKLLEALKNSQKSLESTYICYCAPHKLQTTLHDIKDVLGKVTMSVGHELTKVHESVKTTSIQEAIDNTSEPLGEYTLVFTF